MKAAGLRGVSRRKRPSATVRGDAGRPVPDLVDRDFTAERPDQLWVADITVADITYVPTEEGHLYLAVVVDDAAQGITLVTRGEDLLPATPIHRVLQALLELPVPDWAHHRLLDDDQGRRLAKRDDAVAIRAYREAGHTPDQVRALAGVPEAGRPA